MPKAGRSTGSATPGRRQPGRVVRRPPRPRRLARDAAVLPREGAARGRLDPDLFATAPKRSLASEEKRSWWPRRRTMPLAFAFAADRAFVRGALYAWLAIAGSQSRSLAMPARAQQNSARLQGGKRSCSRPTSQSAPKAAQQQFPEQRSGSVTSGKELPTFKFELEKSEGA